MPQPAHEVKLAVEIGRAGNPRLPGASSSLPRFYVVECACGWSSPLCQSSSRANQLYAEHKGEQAAS